MDEIVFNSLDELKHRVEPALRTRKDEFKLSKFNYITEDDIWNYLTYTKWMYDNNLGLYQMIDDIMTCNPINIDEYLNNKSS